MLYTNFTEKEKADIWNMYHLSKTALADKADQWNFKSLCLSWVCDQINKKYPHISRMSCYKFIDRNKN